MLIRPANPVVARLLVVTARTDLARYAYLRLVMDSTTVGVVLDRRMGERRWRRKRVAAERRSEEHTSELQSRSDLVCRFLLEKKKISITVMVPPQPPMSLDSPTSHA